MWDGPTLDYEFNFRVNIREQNTETETKNGFSSDMASQNKSFHLTKFLPSEIFYLYSLERSITYIRGVWLGFIIITASDLGLHYLPLSRLWDARFKWVKVKRQTQNFFPNDVGTIWKHAYPNI